LIDFQWQECKWRYTTYATKSGQLLIKDHTQQEKPIWWLPANLTKCMLGVYLAPNGNNKMQIQILLDKTQKWEDNAHTRHLNKLAAWLNLISTILWQVHYIVPATMISQAQCNQTMSPCYWWGLLAAGYMWSFPWAILQAPFKYFGLEITNLYYEQGIQHILALLWYGTNPNDTTSKLIWIGLKTLWIELGISGQLFAQDWNTLNNWLHQPG